MRTVVTAVVAESLPVFREAILRMLSYDLGARAADSVDNVEAALDLITAIRPSLAVVDRDLPGRAVLEALPLVREQSPETRIMLLAVHLSDTDVVRASDAGVRGYALKSDTVDELRRTMEGVLAGRVVFSRRLRERPVVRRACNSGRACMSGPFKDLTEREIQVLTYVAQGLSVKEIAALLNVCAKTVDGHKANVMDKLNIHDRVLLTHYAIREGLVSPWSGDGPYRPTQVGFAGSSAR